MIINSDTRLLVVAPHSDDQTLGCGGLINKVYKYGGEVNIVLIATFLQCGFGKWKQESEKYDQYCLKQRRIQFKQGMKVLTEGNYKLFEYDQVCRTLQDRAYIALFDKHPSNYYVSFIQKIVKERNINLLAIPTKSYFKDHNVINEACQAVCRPHFYQGNVIEYSVGNQIQFIPNFFVKLSEQIVNKKIQAFSKHVSQVSPMNHTLSLQNVKDRLKCYGRFIYSDYAEPYKIVRMLDI